MSNGTKIVNAIMRTLRYKAMYYFDQQIKHRFLKDPWVGLEKMNIVFVLRFDLCWHKYNPFSFDLKW